jgi:hypothetical protein
MVSNGPAHPVARRGGTSTVAVENPQRTHRGSQYDALSCYWPLSFVTASLPSAKVKVMSAHRVTATPSCIAG